LGGGVWRLQLVRTECVSLEGGEEWKFLVLASCMHAGTRVVRVTRKLGHGGEGSVWGIDVLAEFTEHESMNYASDVWKPEGGYDLQGKEMSELLFVSSSFYDRRLCLWRVNV
jgi:diphthamide biosynthesis protein 7